MFAEVIIFMVFFLQMATMEAVQTGRQVLVFLLMESIPNKDLGVDLLRYVRSNTYMPYPKQEEEEEEEDIMKNFYDKLAYDLRHWCRLEILQTYK